MKNTVIEVKNTLEGIIDEAEDQLSHGRQSGRNTQLELQKKKASSPDQCGPAG